MDKPTVSVVGAFGLVGRELIELIEKRKIPFSDIKFFGSGNKKRYITFKNKRYIPAKPDMKSLMSSDIVFFVSSDEVSKEYAKNLAQNGIWCIDDSSAFRMDRDVPLVIPEINGNLINEKNRLIAGPNCSLTPLAVSCFNIHKKYQISEIRLSTYQAVSGAGWRALNELFDETKSFIKGERLVMKDKVLPRQIAFNLFPQVGSFDEDGNSVEEKKISDEMRKIWDDDKIKISSYAVRVPVIRGHSLSVWIKTRKEWNLIDIKKILSHTEGCKFFPEHKDYQTPVDVEKKYYVTASRLKKTPFKNEFSLWLCGDNLYKGAALNSVQIAEIIIKKYFN
ncbi:MAG: aspartate-semialdehyde dehydrogenase [Elusimicrobiales bacterium]|nr:aspartate-semialdehyde dehydrogenase [Elusimicrobiales bacterium]